MHKSLLFWYYLKLYLEDYCAEILIEKWKTFLFMFKWKLNSSYFGGVFFSLIVSETLVHVIPKLNFFNL